ncbi:MAG: serine protease [bacterium]|nr:serine protease [bacterium]
MKFLCILMTVVIGCVGSQNISAKAIANIKKVGTISGTAFKVTGGRILTAGHLCEAALAGNANIEFEWQDGERWVATGGEYRVLRLSTTSDICELAVVNSSNNHLKHLELADSWSSLEPISVYGAPIGLGPARTDGYLIGRRGNVFFASVMALPGNSGSPVLNSSGEVLGMLVAGYENISLLVPYQEIEHFLYEK